MAGDETMGNGSNIICTPQQQQMQLSAVKNVKQQQFHYEFGGPWGTATLTLLLPWVVVMLAHWCHVGYFDLSSLMKNTERIVLWLKSHHVQQHSPLMGNATPEEYVAGFFPSAHPTLPNLIGDDIINTATNTLQCIGVVLSWLVFQILLERVLPYELVEGVAIKVSPGHQRPNASTNAGGRQPSPVPAIRLKYRINGHLALWVTLLLVTCGWPTMTSPSSLSGATVWQLQAFPYWSWLYTNFGHLSIASSAVCYFLSAYLYWNSFRATPTNDGKHHNNRNRTPTIVSAGGNSGNPIYDFFMGRELNPRMLHNTFDWKEFCELRPGLIGWIILNLACAHEQHKVQGSVSGSMYLLIIFQGMYVWDALYQEKSILSTMDITTDGFGFMLVFGDLCWVPFVYSLQARYLVHHDPHLTWWQLLCIVAIYLFGYIIFRCSNGQKDQFRRDPSHATVAHLRYLPTRRGTKLLISGWWGLARKINYTGDYLMGLSWCLLCGFDSIIPYFYALYFFILLLHRSMRDDHMCKQKYGDDWTTYKKLVPYKFIPGVV